MSKNRTLSDHAAVAAAFTLAAVVATPGSAQSVRYDVTDLGAPIGGATFGSALNNVGQATGDSGNTGLPGGVGAQVFRFDPDEGMIILNDGPELRSLGQVINDVGQVAGVICVTGELPCDWRLFRHTDGVGLEILGVLGTGSTITPRAINGSGDVVGKSAFGPSSRFHAFLFNDQDGLIDLGTLGEGPISDAMDVNDARQVVGHTSIGEGGGRRAFLWEDGVMQDLGTLGGSNSWATRINDAGQIVGGADLSDRTEHAFRYAPGVGMVDLHPPAAESSRGLFINDSGMVAGTFRTEQTTRAFRFSDEIGLVDIGVFDPAEDSVSVDPVDMNARGQIVGRALNIDFEEGVITSRVFVWAPETGLVDLSTAIDTGPREVVLDAALAINDDGEILVNGRVDDEYRALLLRPITEPAMIIPLSQVRRISTLVSFSKCGEISEEESAHQFDPFNSFLETAQECGNGYGHVLAGQESRIDASSLTAFGNTVTKTTGGGPGTVTVLGDSHFEVTFELPAASSFALDGEILASAIIDGDLELQAEITFTGPEGQTIFTHSVSGGAGRVIHESGKLEPGVYTLLALADLEFDGEVPPLVVGSSSYELTFTVTELLCREDLDGDGTVGFSDILAILEAWGNEGGPEDLNGDGVVDFADVLAVLAAWGPC